MRKTILIFILSLVFNNLFGQVATDNLSGQVSFVSSKNVYVKFISTSGITAGDTIYASQNGSVIPVLVVNNLSSTSCVCSPLSYIVLSVGDKVSAKIRIAQDKDSSVINDPSLAVAAVPVLTDTVIVKQSLPSDTPKQQIRGSLSAYSYSDFSNTGADNSRRFRYTMSLTARNISDSKFSFESYISFRHKLSEWSDVQQDIFSALKIYNLAGTFEPDKTMQISIGRKINYNISSMGAMDGIQFQKTFNRFSLGAVAGFRPDY